MSSLRDRIAASRGYGSERVEFVDGVEVEIRSISVKQHSDLIRASMTGDTVDMGTLIPRLLVLAVFDPETDGPVFTDDDLDMIGELPAGPVERLGFAAMRVSGIDQGALESGKGGS